MIDVIEHIMKRRSFLKVFAALTLAVAICILSSSAGFADTGSVDVTKPVSLTVHPGGGGQTEDFGDSDINGARVVIDLYKVCDVRKMEGYDTIEFTADDTYGYGALFDQSGSGIDIKDFTNKEWRELSQKAAAVALGTSAGSKAQDPLVKGRDIGEKIDGLGAGLYLVIARGSTIGANEYYRVSAEGMVTTIARSSLYEYTFEPELVVLPTKDSADGSGVINTADPSPWIYDADIYLKAARESAKASMKIVKSLNAYETKDPATFIFQVDGVLGSQTYSNVFSIVFDEPGTKEISIDDLPVGMKMTVKEVYSGANYKLTAADNDSESLVISADKVVQATFTNTYDDTYRGGGSITNKFSFDKEADGWQWSGVDDSGNEQKNKSDSDQ